MVSMQSLRDLEEVADIFFRCILLLRTYSFGVQAAKNLSKRLSCDKPL